VTDPAAYKPRLDLLWDIFGEDRVVFGSDWPNSTVNWVSFETTLAIVRQYIRCYGSGDRVDVLLEELDSSM
jgi:predicted TIM-barrel fold metal-dependent hydrolase